MRIENSVWATLSKDDDADDERYTYSVTFVMNTPTGAVIRVVSVGGETESMVFVPGVEAYNDEFGAIDLRLIGGAA